MPIGPWPDFDTAVEELMDQGYSREEAERIAGAMEQESKLEDGDPEGLWQKIKNGASAVIDELDLGTFSFVDTPAQPSAFVMMKSQDCEYDWKSATPLLKDPVKEDEEGGWEVCYGPVMVPGIEDKQGDVIPAHVIKESAHDFLEAGKVQDIDSDHNLITNKGKLVESWLLKEDKEYELPDGEVKEYPKGTWMVGVKPEDEIKERIENGELNGFSIYGEADKIHLKSVEKQEDPHIIAANLWFNGTEKQREIFGNGSEGRGRSERPPGEWWNEAVEFVQSLREVGSVELSEEEKSIFEDLKVKFNSNNDDRYNELNQSKEDKNMTEQENTEENTSEKDDEEISLKDIKESLTELKETIEESKQTAEESEDSEKEESEEEKQNIEDIADAVDYIEENLPDDVASMIVDAIRSSQESAENGEDEDDEEMEEDKSDDSETVDEEKEAKVKKGDEEETRKNQIDTDSSKRISLKKEFLGGD